MKTSRTRWIASRSRAAAVVAVLCGVGTGVAYATGSIPGAGGVIQGCYDGGGNLKVVAALPCPKGYTGLQWSQQGPPGTNGTNGADGTNGTDGVSGYEIATDTTALTSGAHGVAGVACPAGKRALGGGALVTRVIPGVGEAEYLDERGVVDGSFPNSDGTGWAFHYNLDNPNGYEIHIELYVTCATMN